MSRYSLVESSTTSTQTIEARGRLEIRPVLSRAIFTPTKHSYAFDLAATALGNVTGNYKQLVSANLRSWNIGNAASDAWHEGYPILAVTDDDFQSLTGRNTRHTSAYFTPEVRPDSDGFTAAARLLISILETDRPADISMKISIDRTVRPGNTHESTEISEYFAVRDLPPIDNNMTCEQRFQVVRFCVEETERSSR